MNARFFRYLPFAAFLQGCGGSSFEAVNYGEGECSLSSNRAPVLERRGHKVFAICLPQPVAELIQCSKSVAESTDINADGRTGDEAESEMTDRRNRYEELAPLLAARANGLSACRRKFEKDTGLGADTAASSRAHDQLRTAMFSSCMSGLEKLNQGAGETAMRLTLANQCLRLLQPALVTWGVSSP